MLHEVRDELYFRLRGWIPIPLYAGTLLAFDPLPAAHWEQVLGIALAAAGVALRGWARLQIGRSSDTRRLHARRLVTTGPYALLRNPLYAANVSIACGLAVLIGAREWAAALALLLGLHYRRVVRAEETMLEATFGAAYRRYCTRVRRWWPVARAAPALYHRGDCGDLWREWRIAALALLGTALGVALRL
jgi:protein-S-isoprenylcysteine O-methyltransferase Ste14